MRSTIMLLAMQCARAFVAPGVRRMATSLKAGDAMAVDAATTFLFPGQGAQSVGMAVETCEAVPAAKKLFDEASEILGYDLLAKCAEGPKAELDSTAVSQPAIFVSSMAAVEKLRAESPDVVDSATCAMGLSLGEYSALCFAGAISFADGVKLTKLRGEAMQAASDAQPSGMVSVIGLDKGKVADLCKAASDATGEPIGIANFLCNGNYACSGSMVRGPASLWVPSSSSRHRRCVSPFPARVGASSSTKRVRHLTILSHRLLSTRSRSWPSPSSRRAWP